MEGAFEGGGRNGRCALAMSAMVAQTPHPRAPCRLRGSCGLGLFFRSLLFRPRHCCDLLNADFPTPPGLRRTFEFCRQNAAESNSSSNTTVHCRPMLSIVFMGQGVVCFIGMCCNYKRCKAYRWTSHTSQAPWHWMLLDANGRKNKKFTVMTTTCCWKLICIELALEYQLTWKKRGVDNGTLRLPWDQKIGRKDERLENLCPYVYFVVFNRSNRNAVVLAIVKKLRFLPWNNPRCKES